MTKAYAVLWITGTGMDMMVNALVYRGFGGGVRTYYEGHLDPRAGIEEQMPRFDDVSEAMAFMIKNQGVKALVEVTAAKTIRNDHYADPV